MAWIFFDLDGTLLDSLGGLQELWDDLVSTTGLSGAITFEQCNGLGLHEIVALMVRASNGRLDAAATMQLYRERLAALYASVSPTEGASEVLRAFESSGWSIGIVTAAESEFASLALERHTWFGLIKLLVTGDEVSRGKPAPDLYLRGLERAESPPAGGFAVEDSPNGVKAAVGAGLQAVGFTGHSSGDLLREAGAVDTIEHLLELVEHPRLRS